MSFFTRKRDELAAKGIDPGRIPPGQDYTERFPVLHAGTVPRTNLAEWDFTVDGSTSTALRNGRSSTPTGKGPPSVS